MKASYAVKWREPDGKTYLGRLGFQPNALILESGENGSIGGGGMYAAVRRRVWNLATKGERR